MPNNYYGQVNPLKLSKVGGGSNGRSGSAPSMKEKPAFPSAKAGGKTQRDRSGGTPKCKQHPKCEGL